MRFCCVGILACALAEWGRLSLREAGVVPCAIMLLAIVALFASLWPATPAPDATEARGDG